MASGNGKTVNTHIVNNYTIKPRNLTQYTAFRGITDFTNIGQFAQYNTGYNFLSVLQTPQWINDIITKGKDTNIQNLQNSFVHMLEFEFRGLDGLPDMTADTMEITDGVNTQRLINKVNWDTATTVSMNYFEKTGSLITKYSEFYLTGLADRMSQAKTYHGGIANGWTKPSPENEIFTLMYYVTDSTYLRLERAVLLCNCQLTKAELSMYNGQRGEYGNKEMSIEFNCYPVVGAQVDKAASYLLQDITEVRIDGSKDNLGADKLYNITNNYKKKGKYTPLDSYDYTYGIMNSGQSGAPYIGDLDTALKGNTNFSKEYASGRS